MYISSNMEMSFPDSITEVSRTYFILCSLNIYSAISFSHHLYTSFSFLWSMGIYAFEGRKPKIDETSYVSSAADIIGDVTIGKECYIGPGARIKGDYGTIIIGDCSNVQENCVLHARPNETTSIGDWVTIGHGAIIHGGQIEDWAIIGMGSIVSDHSIIGPWAVVAEGAVVTNGTHVPEETVCVGIPAKSKGTIDEDFKEKWVHYKEIYRSLSKRYKEELTPL